MSLDEINFPDVNYGSDNKDKMYELTHQEYSPFFGCDYWEVFIFCMSYAYAKGFEMKKVPGTGSLPAKVFQTPARNLMRAVAIDHLYSQRKKDDTSNPLDIIKNPKEYVKICEMYAYSGFNEIYNIITENDTSKTKHEDLLMNLIKTVVASRN